MHCCSIHPCYFDKNALIATWREGLRIQKALRNGDNRDPGLACFKYVSDPLRAIGSYLSFLAAEGARRGCKLAHERILYPNFDEEVIPLDHIQFDSDTKAIRKKLNHDNSAFAFELPESAEWKIHPAFTVIPQILSASHNINNKFERL